MQTTERHAGIAKILSHHRAGMLTDKEMVEALVLVLVSTECSCLGCQPG